MSYIRSLAQPPAARVLRAATRPRRRAGWRNRAVVYL